MTILIYEYLEISVKGLYKIDSINTFPAYLNSSSLIELV